MKICRTHRGALLFLFTLFFSLLVVVLVRPLWDWVQGWVDAIFFRTRFDYAETIESVSQALTRTLDAQEVTAHVQRAVADTIAPASCLLYIRSLDGGELRSATGSGGELDLDDDTRNALVAGQSTLSTHRPVTALW